MSAMSVGEWLAELGGYATWGTLVHLTSRQEVEAAVDGGDLVKVARGRYALSGLKDAQHAAHRVNGVLSHASAALHWGWEVKQLPAEPHVTVPKWRTLTEAEARGLRVHRANLGPGEVVDGVTSKEVTLLQCLRTLSWPEALAVADSALRDGFGKEAMRRLGEAAKGPGAPQIRRATAEATELAANPFESVLRAIALDVKGLAVRPQTEIIEFMPAITARPDLVDEELRIAVEADSFEWHGGRAALAKDARRYNLLIVNGWIVLRFSWEDVMQDPEYVREILIAAVALAETLTKVRCSCQSAA